MDYYEQRDEYVLNHEWSTDVDIIDYSGLDPVCAYMVMMRLAELSSLYSREGILSYHDHVDKNTRPSDRFIMTAEDVEIQWEHLYDDSPIQKAVYEVEEVRCGAGFAYDEYVLELPFSNEEQYYTMMELAKANILYDFDLWAQDQVDTHWMEEEPEPTSWLDCAQVKEKYSFLLLNNNKQSIKKNWWQKHIEE